jgi:polyisoprenoid-binding protein YceI
VLRSFLAVGLLIGSSLNAQQLSVDLDAAKTEIHWSLAGNVHTVHGTFHLKQGHVTLDPATGVITGDVVADAASGESGNGTRDKRMNKEVLESGKFPEFRFTPQKVEGAVSIGTHSTVRVSGTFQVHGGTHNVTIPMDVSLADGTVTGRGKFSIPFVDWGMKDPSNFLFKVDKSVEVEIVAVGRLQAK